eukprot:XP_001706511.1 Hypothetical protein GL50803_3997 [Giardia lamblia ATCC 50803]
MLELHHYVINAVNRALPSHGELVSVNNYVIIGIETFLDMQGLTPHVTVEHDRY